MKLVNKYKIEGKLIVKTGMHIGGMKETFQIGGSDSPVIKTKNGMPYIPGSSLKGKLRSLLEKENGEIKVTIEYLDNKNKIIGKTTKKYGEVTNEDIKSIPNEYKSQGATRTNLTSKPCGCGECNICILFGSSESKTIKRPNALIFRDAHPVENMDIKRSLETKAENIIDRVKGTAEHPRFIERVVPDTVFDVEIIYNKFDSDNDKELLETLKKGFELLENDYLGGSGTRGYGKVDVKAIINDIDSKIGKLK